MSADVLRGRFRERSTCLLLACLSVVVISGLAAVPACAATQGSPQTASSPGASAGGAQPAAWTFALFVNGDNDLAYTWPRFTLPALKALPASDDVNVVAMVDRPGATGARLVQVSGGTRRIVARWGERNFGSGETLEWFLNQVRRRFPSDHYAVGLWDHGYGWRYISRDFHSNDDRITMPALRRAVRRAGVPIDVLFFDACNMADVEVLYELGLTGLVKYVVGSEETVDQDGIPYDGALAPLVADPGRSPGDVAADAVDAWRRYYEPLRCFNWTSLSAIDMGRFSQAEGDLRAWVARLREDLPLFRARYAAALRKSIYAWDSWHVDLAQVAARLAADPAITDATLRSLSAAVADHVTAATVDLWSGSYASDFRGMSIWWGTGPEWREYRDAYERQVAFGKRVGWYAFLKAYNRGGGPGKSRPPDPRLDRQEYGLTDVVFTDADHGWAAGYDNVGSEAIVLRTTDGGLNWRAKSPAWWYAYMVSSLSFADERRGWAVGSEGYDGSVILKTKDGGARWNWQSGRTSEFLLGVDAVDPSSAWVGGSNDTLLRTEDGGRHWDGGRSRSNTDLWSVDFADALRGWVAGGDAASREGVIRYTSDGGESWATQTTLPGAVVYKVQALDADRAWAVGGDVIDGAGVVLHTDDAGQHWLPQYADPACPWLGDVQFLDAASGWAVGARGTVLRTADGGGRWERVDIGTVQDVSAVCFSDADHGWVVGDGEAMFRTQDGGVTWETVTVDVVGPVTQAPNATTVRRGADAALRYRVQDSKSATARVTIVIRACGRAVVKTLACGTRAVGVSLARSFVCRLPRGSYRFFVHAKDESGNPQRVVGSNKLVVR